LVTVAPHFEGAESVVVCTNVTAPGHISVDILLDITSSLAKLDAKFDAKFGAVEASIAELKSVVTALKVDVSGLKVDVAVLKVDVGALKADVSGLKKGAKAMEADVRKLLDWKQRLWGMVLLISVVTAVAPSVWRELVQLVSGLDGIR
jgi:prophage DNA circulation protein